MTNFGSGALVRAISESYGPSTMTGTPPSFADTPERPTGPDVLSEMLRAVRLTGSVFFNGRFPSPSGVISPKRWDDGTPMARLRHVSVFHLVASGGCMIEIATGERRQIRAGDILLLPFADQHRFWSGEPTSIALAADIIQPG